MKATRISFAAVFLLAPTSAFSAKEFVSGDDLFSKCGINNPLCTGYIAGVADIMSTNEAIEGASTFTRSCSRGFRS